MTPFGPTITPGVEKPCSANSAVIVENAVPISTARPSRARAPATVSASDAKLVSAAAVPTSPKWSSYGIITAREPARTTMATGTRAARIITARVRTMPGVSARVTGL